MKIYDESIYCGCGASITVIEYKFNDGLCAECHQAYAITPCGKGFILKIGDRFVELRPGRTKVFFKYERAVAYAKSHTK